MAVLKDNDVVIVGAGLAGAIAAYELGKAGLSVMLIESGPALPPSREEFVERFFTQVKKFPESPYAPNPNAPNARTEHVAHRNDRGQGYLDQSQSPLPFSSSYERRSGGTTWHWLGTSLRLVPNDFRMQSAYDVGVDWPIGYDELGLPQAGRAKAYYDMAEEEIGVSANVADQNYLGIKFTRCYDYPHPGIPESLTDRFFREGLDRANFLFDGQRVSVSPTPAGRLSRPSFIRRTCSGNSSCIPICPTQAKYDATLTLHKAFSTGNVHALFQAVASRVNRDDEGKKVTGIEVIRYESPEHLSPCGTDTVEGRIYVLAGNAIETPKLLLHSGFRNDNIGRYLMDHPYYVRWGLTPQPTYPYRGPLATAGIESLRDGPFRKTRAAFRVDLGNEGWNLAVGDPYTTTLDWIEGSNQSQTNDGGDRLHGAALLRKLNDIFTRQFRFGFLIEQSADRNNRVTLSDRNDALGIPRPRINYDISDYTKAGFVAAKKLSDRLFSTLHIDGKRYPPGSTMGPSGRFSVDGEEFRYYGAGHLIGTYRMGTNAINSAVDKFQRSWEFRNLFLLGSGVFPSAATANPSLTIAALSFWAAHTIRDQLMRK